MVSVESAWLRAWAVLDPGDRASISRADGRAPANFFVKALFPGLFGDLDVTLRSVRALTSGGCSDVQLEQVGAAVRSQKAHLEGVGRLLPALKSDVARRGLTWTKERDPMARLASRLVKTEPDPEGAWAREVERHYSEHVPDADGVRSALADEDLVARLEQRLAERGTYRVVHDCDLGGGGHCELDALLDEFLDAELVGPGGTPTDADEEPGWASIRDHPCLPSVHRWARGLGLSRLEVPKVPAIRSERFDGSTSVWHERHRLDSAIEERVAGALRGDRRQRQGIPAERLLLEEEVGRASMPLGLETAISWATLALARRVLLRVPTTSDAESRVVSDVRRRFARWRREASETGAYPRLPPSVRNAAEDPDLWYASLLWRRVHGHETRRMQEGSALATHLALTGIAVTVVERLRQASGAFTTGLDDADRLGAVALRGVDGPRREAVELDGVDTRVTALLRGAARELSREDVQALVGALFESHRDGEQAGEAWHQLRDAARRAGHADEIDLATLKSYLRRHAS